MNIMSKYYIPFLQWIVQNPTPGPLQVLQGKEEIEVPLFDWWTQWRWWDEWRRRWAELQSEIILKTCVKLLTVFQGSLRANALSATGPWGLTYCSYPQNSHSVSSVRWGQCNTLCNTVWTSLWNFREMVSELLVSSSFHTFSPCLHLRTNRGHLIKLHLN